CYLGAFLYLTFAMLPLFISLCTKHLYPDQITGDTQLVLPTMVLTHTNIFVQIVFFGSLISAIMSTTSSALLAPASICAENIVKPLMKGAMSDQQLLLVTRVSVLVFSIVASVMACIRSNIYELVSESSILSLVSLFIPLSMVLYWRRANARGRSCRWSQECVPGLFLNSSNRIYHRWCRRQCLAFSLWLPEACGRFAPTPNDRLNQPF